MNKYKTFNISCYQLPLIPTFCLIDLKIQGQTFEHLVINLHQPPNNVQHNMHNIYVTFYRLHLLNELMILQDLIIQNICKANFKKRLLEMTIIHVRLDIEEALLLNATKKRNKCNM